MQASNKYTHMSENWETCQQQQQPCRFVGTPLPCKEVGAGQTPICDFGEVLFLTDCTILFSISGKVFIHCGTRGEIIRMPCLKRCCFCVTLRTGGITMGIMTLAMSLFSIIPMAFLLANRVFWARIITHLVLHFYSFMVLCKKKVCLRRCGKIWKWCRTVSQFTKCQFAKVILPCEPGRHTLFPDTPFCHTTTLPFNLTFPSVYGKPAHLGTGIWQNDNGKLAYGKSVASLHFW